MWLVVMSSAGSYDKQGFAIYWFGQRPINSYMWQ